MNDTVQVLFAFFCVYITQSWAAWLLDASGYGRAERGGKSAASASPRSAHCRVQCMAAGLACVGSAEDAAAPESAPTEEQLADDVALPEQCEFYAARPGAWTGRSAAALTGAVHTDDSSSELRTGPSESKAEGLGLLEQYALFGARPGAWSGRATPLAHMTHRDDAEESAAPEVNLIEQRRSEGFALLEQYALFGARPGAWSGQAVPLADAAYTKDRRTPHGTPAEQQKAEGLALLEHYTLFGAKPGAWSGSQAVASTIRGLPVG